MTRDRSRSGDAGADWRVDKHLSSADFANRFGESIGAAPYSPRGFYTAKHNYESKE